MKIRVIITGKSAPEAEAVIEHALSELGDVDVKFMTDSGMRVIIAYEEKKAAKVLTKKADNCNIGERAKEASYDSKDTPHNKRRSKGISKNKDSAKPTGRKGNGGSGKAVGA